MNLFRDFVNYVLLILPVSRFFALKRALLRLMGVVVGKDVKVNGHTWFYGRGKISIGDRTWIGPRCQFHATFGTMIDVGADCDFAPEVMFVTGTHKIGRAGRRAGEGYAQDIKVGDGCWLGARVTVLGNVTIGSGSIIAAGSLVKSHFPQNSLAAGVPAELKKSLSD